MTKKKKLIYISVGFILLLVMAYVLFVAEDKKKYTKEAFVEPETVQTIQEGVVSSKKMYDFILSKVPNSEAFLKIHLEGEDVSVSVRQKATMEMFYAAIKQQEVDFLTASLDMKAFQSLWGETNDFKNREQILIDTLKEIDRNGQLSTLSYKLEKDKYGIEGNTGLLTLSYKDGSEVVAPFTFIKTGDDDHVEFTLAVSLQEVVEEIERLNLTQ